MAQYNPYAPVHDPNRAPEHIEMSAQPIHSSPYASPYHHAGEIPLSHSPALPNIEDLPPGAAATVPRFYGSARYDDPVPRQSIAESIGGTSSGPYDPNRPFDNNSSHALNPYHDDPHGGAAPVHGYRDDPNGPSHYYDSSADTSNAMLGEKKGYYDTYQNEKKPRRKGLLVGGIIVGLLLLAAAVVVPIYFFVIRKNSDSTDGGNSSDPSSTNGPSAPTATLAALTGGDGSEVTLEGGAKFTYVNKFGGHWVYDPNNPFNNSARPQSWSPPLNQPFQYGVDKIRGVNLGGWLVTEPFIVPALYEKYYNSTPRPVDEWTLSAAMRAAGALETDMENHYKTFITEQDFAAIAAAGLNYIRIPIGYWAIETRDDEPFLAKVSWQYFLKAITWARKYGLRINLDVHGHPGSQNAWNHSGRINILNFLHGPTGLMNGERSLGYIRALAQFICQPQYKDVIELFGIINEPRSENYIGRDVLAAWYLEAYRIVKEVCGTGQGNGPYVSIHNGFESPANWVGLYPNADRMAMDMHPYLAFNDRQDPSPPSSRIALPCSIWGDMTNNSQQSFGLTTAGEWSLAINDCGQWVNGVDLGDRFGGTFAGSTGVGNCDTWNNWPAWSPAIRRGFLDLTLTSMDALQNYFFWTWKIGNSTRTGKVEAPFWSYSLGLAQGWIPTDPRDAVGACARAGVVGNQYDGTPAPWQIGGTGAGNIPASNLAALAWPPAMIAEGGPVAALPRYTPTGPNPTLPGPTQPAGATSSIDFGNGLHNPQATGGAYVPIVGCTYPDAWATDVPRPNAAFCPAAAAGAPPADAPPVDADPAAPTPAPKL